MSQHDFDIANAAGAVVRADLNAVLEAIATQNAGSSAPSTTFAHQWWLDEANNLLKQRNAANTLWVTVALKDSNGWTPYYRGQAWGTPFDVSNSDLDDLDETQFFSGNNLTNAPFGGGGTFNGLHLKFSATTAFQLAWAATTSTLRGRQKTGAGTWNSWTLLGAVQVTAGEITAGTESSVRMFSPDQIRQMIATHGGGAFEGALLHVRDEKAAGTDGGTFTSGAWQTRDLNTVKTNEISGASLATNQITLPAGTYYIEASAPAFATQNHVLKLANITDTADTLIGTAEFHQPGNDAGEEHYGRSFVRGRFTIAAEKVFELQHRCLTTKATNGFGSAANFGVVEVYADVAIWKVA